MEMSSMKTIHVKFNDELSITPSDLIFVDQILGKSGFVKKINYAPVSNEYLQKQNIEFIIWMKNRVIKKRL